MRKNLLLVIGAVMILAIGFNSCESNDEEQFNTKSNNYKGEVNLNDVFSYSQDDMNVLHVLSVKGNIEDVLSIKGDIKETESCSLYQPYCGRLGYSIINSDANNIGHVIFPMIFTAAVKNSSVFNVLQFDIWVDGLTNIDSLKVGDTFVNIPFSISDNYIYLRAWKESGIVDKVIPWQVKSGALDGQVQVVDKKIDKDGKPHIILALQNLKFYDYDSNWEEVYYIINAMVDFEICENGIYPNQ